MPPAVDFRARVDELRTLASARPRPQDRQIVQNALDSKWEGLQSVAIQTLGCWGDRQSFAILRELWPKCSWTLQPIVARSLAQCVQAEDAPWALDLYFEGSEAYENGYWLGVVMSLPPQSARERLLLESRSHFSTRRSRALVAMARMAFPDRETILQRFLNDDDREIRNAAEYWLKHKSR